MLPGDLPADDPTDYPKYLATEWEVRIGNSPIWHENPVCPGDPELKSTFDDVFSDSSIVGNIWVPAFGFRKQCNMSGMYTFYVARTIPTESVTLCDTAVIGTAFIRDEPLADTIEVQAGETATLSVPHVRAQDTIGNVIAIDLRLGDDSELTSVQLTNGATATDVIIDTTGLTVGTHVLKLESFDTNGEVFSSLKIDTVTIVVVAPPADPTTEVTEE